MTMSIISGVGSDLELSVWRVKKERNIMDKDIFGKMILVGPKDDGKITVANMMVQGKIFLRNRVSETPPPPPPKTPVPTETTIITASTRTSRIIQDEVDGEEGEEKEEEDVPERASIQLVDGRGWIVCVVDGFQELVQGTSEEAKSIKQEMIYTMREGPSCGFNLFSLVVRCDHVFGTEIEGFLRDFKKLFAGVESRFVLIITNCSDVWVEDHERELEGRFNEFIIIPVQFLFDENMPNMFQSQREATLNALEDILYPYCNEAIIPEFLNC
ncbi:hypothetical protein BGZ76_011302 [Entomortierella beljakovae]|nr:hypothetical protein BGZ76_011302 [Entomortierella beljakovae]